MVEEWLARDTLAGALQAGIDPEEAALRLEFAGYQGSWANPAPTDVLTEGDSGPRPDDYRPECEMVLEFIEEVWNHRHLNRVPDFMIRDLVLQTIGDTTVIRPDGYQRDLLDLVAPFPDATFAVRDVQTNFSERYAGLRIAVLWQMKATYRGNATFGPLTHQPVDLMGISQFLVQGGRIVRETRVYDQLALRAQINNTRGDGSVDVNANIY
jgi:predicted ester cyclase